MGVPPGVELVLLQRMPAFVFRMGHAEFAVDAELAGHVRVRREYNLEGSLMRTSPSRAPEARIHDGVRVLRRAVAVR
jgi:hypothetical protein